MHNAIWILDIPCEFTLLFLNSVGPNQSRCFGAASAKDRLDVVIRNAINAGDIPGPRYLANGKEICRRDGELVASVTAFADGPEEMREVIQHHVNLDVDEVKLSMSGEEVSETVNTLIPLSTLITDLDYRDSVCARLLLHRRRDSCVC